MRNALKQEKEMPNPQEFDGTPMDELLKMPPEYYKASPDYKDWDYRCRCGVAMRTVDPHYWLCESCGFIWQAWKGVSFEEASDIWEEGVSS